MDKGAIGNFLRNIGQSHLSYGIDTLSAKELESFACDLTKYGKDTLPMQVEAMEKTSKEPEIITPLMLYEKERSKEEESQGKEILRLGKVGCLLLAGGQGTRFGSHGPKGLTTVSLVKQKSLFQIFLEKTLAASKQVDRPLSLAIMTSPQNHEQTCAFLEQNGWFGLDREQISIFMQEEIPFLDPQRRWLLEAPGKIAKGPNGNGFALQLLEKSGIAKKWRTLGIEMVNVVQIDNPLADPFDAAFLGFHQRKQSLVSMKVVRRTDPDEKVGVICLKNNKVQVAEYFEMGDALSKKRDSKGDLLFPLVNIGLFCFSMDFIALAAQSSLPWHMAKKTTEALCPGKESEGIQKIDVCKFETFIFDVFVFADTCSVIEYPRKECYSALKNAQGERSIKTVQRDLLERDRQVFKQITGNEAPSQIFELDPAFYYPTEKLLHKWKGQSLPSTAYVEP